MQVSYLWHVRCTWAGPCTDATRRRQITTRHCPSRPQVPIFNCNSRSGARAHGAQLQIRATRAQCGLEARLQSPVRAPGTAFGFAGSHQDSGTATATSLVPSPGPAHPVPSRAAIFPPGVPSQPRFGHAPREPKCLWLEFAVVYHLITILIYRRSLLCACEQRKTSSCARCDHCIQAAHMPSEGVVCHAYAILVRYASAAPRRS